MNCIRLSDSEERVTLLGVENGTKFAPKGSILILVRGSMLHQRIPIGIAANDVTFNQDVKAIVPTSNVLPEFLLYWLLSNEPKLLEMVEFTGIGAGKLSTDLLYNMEVKLPPLPEQRAIARILGSLDEKIEANRRMNETLEAMARTLFKSWFVDFDPVRAKAAGREPAGMDAETAALFPDSFEETEMGEVPRGWGLKSFAETVEIIGGGTPKTSIDDYWNGDVPWFSVVDSPREGDVWVIDAEKKITLAGVENSSTRILSQGTTIISARGAVGRVALVGVPMAMNQSCYGLRGEVGEKGFFTYFSTRALVSDLQQKTHGSVFDTITRDTLKGVIIASPPSQVVQKFEQNVAALLERIRENNFESRTLAALRDVLLPKLICGEIRVMDEKQILVEGET